MKIRLPVLVGLTTAVAAFGACGSSDGASTQTGATSDISLQSPPPTSSTPTSPTTEPTQTPSTAPDTVAPDASDDLEYPVNTNLIEAEPGPDSSVERLAADSDVVLVATVELVESLGRPAIAEDEFADEYLAVSLRADEVLEGDESDPVVLPWQGFNVDADGNRVATWVINGLPVPRVGDRMLLFLVDIDPAASRAFGGVPTHVPTQLEGVAFLDESGAVVHAATGSPLFGPLADLAADVAADGESPFASAKATSDVGMADRSRVSPSGRPSSRSWPGPSWHRRSRCDRSARPRG